MRTKFSDVLDVIHNQSQLKHIMTAPSFARATRSSDLKNSTSNSKRIGVATSESPQSPRNIRKSPQSSRRLKRPPTLTKRARESIAYNADLYYIKPSKSSKPCPLAELPSELRSLIYSYTFGDLQKPVLMNFGRIRPTPPPLLQSCRAIRIEAAYMYFAEASFTWVVKNLNFVTVMKWLKSLQASHRALLSRNRNLTIEIIPELKKSYTYPPKDFFLDDTMQNHWRACQPFGNLYDAARIRLARMPLGTMFGSSYPDALQDSHKAFYILFCRLVAWSSFCAQPPHAGIEWNYLFDLPSNYGDKQSFIEGLAFYHRRIPPFLQQLKTWWTRNQYEDWIRLPLLRLHDAFAEAVGRMESSNGVTFKELDWWDTVLPGQRRLIESWNRNDSGA